jgi:hypothetical protein
MINKLWPHLVWWFGLCKDAFHESWATSSLHIIIHIFKNKWFKSHWVRMFIHFLFSFFLFRVWSPLWRSCLIHFLILQVECQNVVSNKHKKYLWNKKASSIFQKFH